MIILFNDNTINNNLADRGQAELRLLHRAQPAEDEELLIIIIIIVSVVMIDAIIVISFIINQ